MMWHRDKVKTQLLAIQTRVCVCVCMAREFMYVHKLNFKEVHTHDCARTYPQMAYGPGRAQTNDVVCKHKTTNRKERHGKSDHRKSDGEAGASEMEYAIKPREREWLELFADTQKRHMK